MEALIITLCFGAIAVMFIVFGTWLSEQGGEEEEHTVSEYHSRHIAANNAHTNAPNFDLDHNEPAKVCSITTNTNSNEVVNCLIDGMVEELGFVNYDRLSPQCKHRMDSVIAAAHTH